MRSKILHGDCLSRLRSLPANSVDSLVTDPPAGISFMGKDWDHHKGGRDQWIAWLESVMRECYRVLKPGAHGLVWALPRTSHWTATACENAGFQIREKCLHLFGSGFPKSKSCRDIGRPELGSALKPAFEEWIMIRKPLEKGLTISQNVLRWGTGALAIDASRIGHNEVITAGKSPKTPQAGWDRPWRHNPEAVTALAERKAKNAEKATQLGRWPANLVLSPDAAEELDRQSGTTPSNRRLSKQGMRSAGVTGWRGTQANPPSDTGGASRFFYVAKPSRRERNAGCEGMPERTGPGSKRSAPAEGRALALGAPRANHHPTVKPIALMRYLIRMVTPPGGLVLDCFLGSGTTACAAKKEGFRFLGIEQSAEYVAISKARIAAA